MIAPTVLLQYLDEWGREHFWLNQAVTCKGCQESHFFIVKHQGQIRCLFCAEKQEVL